MIIEVISGLFAGAVAGAMAGTVAGYFAGWQYATALDALKRRVDALWGNENSQKGVQAREMNAAQEAVIIAQAAEIFKSEDPDKMQKLAGLAAQNPAIAMKLLKKFGMG